RARLSGSNSGGVDGETPAPPSRAGTARPARPRRPRNGGTQLLRTRPDAACVSRPGIGFRGPSRGAEEGKVGLAIALAIRLLCARSGDASAHTPRIMRVRA